MTPGEPSCSPGNTRCSSSTILLTCTASGAETSTPCALGCDAAVTPAACKLPSTSNNVNPSWTSGVTEAWQPTANAAIDTTSGTISGLPKVTFKTVKQAGGGELGVFVFKTLVIPKGTTIKVSGTRAVALLAETITIAGTLDLTGGRGKTQTSGPGGFAGSTSATAGLGPGGGTSGKTSTSVQDGGGGGGGHAGKGGKGGQSLGGAGGVTHGAATLIPLAGGSGGGAGAQGAGTILGSGGGGGGAIQLVALDTITVDGVINAGGGGGAPGNPVAANGGASGGGGAGGAILIEAPTVTLGATAVLAANGGGGGGSPKFENKGNAGTTGLASAQAAAGGAAALDEGAGGDGSTGGKAGTAGVDGQNNGGGGGGGAGRVRINAQVPASGGLISAALTQGTLLAR